MMTSPWRLRSVIYLCLAVAACGGGDGNPAQPGGSGSGSGGSLSTKGTLTCLVDGVSYTGGINSATYTNGVLNIASNSASLTLAVGFAARGGVGTIQVSSGNVSVSVITTNGSTVTGSWLGTNIGGTGSVTINTLTSTGASGTFSFTAPAAGSGATGIKTVTSGVFSATF
jgi:hypothetical protein